MTQPISLDLKKDRGLTVQWDDGSSSYFSVTFLRRMSPSADMRQLRDEIARNPLTVLPSSPSSSAPLTVTNARLVGNYALQLDFSDGHSTGIYSWTYLREIDPQRQPSPNPAPPADPTPPPSPST